MTKPDILPVALVQQSYEGNDKLQQDKTGDNIRKCAKNGARLIVLPELHNSAYFCQTEDAGHFQLAEAVPGPSTRRFGKLAKELKVILVLSLFEKRAPGIYHNTAVVMESDGEIAGIYRKMHIPEDPGYYEKYYFAPGDRGFHPLDTSVGKLGVMVCWDQWFPEAARLMTLAGAEILIYPTAIGWDPRDDAKKKAEELDAWLTIQRSHAIANALPLVAVNRTGHEKDPSGRTDGIAFWGNSFACGPMGEMLCRAGTEDENLLIGIDLSKTNPVREQWPFLRDRRIESYEDLTRRYL
jgi:N-carbamoylputrescine amidase